MKISNCMHHKKRSRSKNHMINSINAGKTFDKNFKSIHKISEENRKRRNAPQHNKV
jgi:hypothetical protein